jgi:hypothetical protein
VRLRMSAAVRGVMRSRRVLSRIRAGAGVWHRLGMVSRLGLVRRMGMSMRMLFVERRRSGGVGVVAVLTDGRGEWSRIDRRRQLLVQRRGLLVLGRVDGSVLVLERALIGGSRNHRATGINGEIDNPPRLRLDDLGPLPSHARLPHWRFPLPSRRDDHLLLVVVVVTLPILRFAIVFLARQILLVYV